jgi:hypothetical protein
MSRFITEVNIWNLTPRVHLISTPVVIPAFSIDLPSPRKSRFRILRKRAHDFNSMCSR